MNHFSRKGLVALSVIVLLVVGALVPPARADERAPGTDAKPAALHPNLNLSAVDLLPFDDVTRAAFNAKNPAMIYRVQGTARQLGTLNAKLARWKGKKTKQHAELVKERKRLRTVSAALMARLTHEVMAHGVDGSLIAYMNHAPTGPGRIQRYSHGLVLLLDDLTPQQRRRFEQVVVQVAGAYHAITAQKERTLLAVKQSELDKTRQGGIAQTFQRQLQVIDQRFWQLVDYTLARDQKAWIWQRLPSSKKRKSQATEHLYALPGLTASQGTRLRSLLTEIEHETAPDRAAIARVRSELNAKDKKLSGARRKALANERNAAYKRIGALNAFKREQTLSILSEAQWLEYLAIPPSVAINDRTGSYGRLVGGWKPGGAQQKQIAALNKVARQERRKTQKRAVELRRKNADYGPDSPQMAGMEMAMNGVKADQARANRAVIGKIFLEVMTAEELGRWVLGTWGYKR